MKTNAKKTLVNFCISVIRKDPDVIIYSDSHINDNMRDTHNNNNNNSDDDLSDF